MPQEAWGAVALLINVTRMGLHGTHLTLSTAYSSFSNVKCDMNLIISVFLMCLVAQPDNGPDVIAIDSKGNYAVIEGHSLKIFDPNDQLMKLESIRNFFSVQIVSNEGRSIVFAFDGIRTYLVDLQLKEEFYPAWIPSGYECTCASVSEQKLILGLSPKLLGSATVPIGMLDNFPTEPMVMSLELPDDETSLSKVRDLHRTLLKTIPGYSIRSVSLEGETVVAFRDVLEDAEIRREFVLLRTADLDVVRRWTYAGRTLELSTHPALQEELKERTADGKADK